VLDQELFGPAAGLTKGAYILADPPGQATPELILVASGSEVHTALAAQEELAGAGIPVRVVSMPSWELFAAQPRDYRDHVLPPRIGARIAVEAAASFGWERHVGREGVIIGIDRFGASAPGEVNLEKFGITPAAIVAAARKLLGRT